MTEGGAEAGGGVLFRLLRCACPLAVASAPAPPRRLGNLSWFVAVETLRSSGNNLLQELCGVFASANFSVEGQHLRTALIGCQREMGPLAAQGTDPVIGGADHHAAPPSSSLALWSTLSTAVAARACLLSALSALAVVGSVVVLCPTARNRPREEAREEGQRPAAVRRPSGLCFRSGMKAHSRPNLLPTDTLHTIEVRRALRQDRSF